LPWKKVPDTFSGLHVVKEQGFSNKLNLKPENGKPIEQTEAEENRKLMDAKFDKGKYTYSYLWADAGKPKGVAIKDREKAILAVLDKETKKLVGAMGVKLDTYKGQKLVGDAGVSEEAGLGGN
jgi:hypothetical protein